jgi:two-component system chemotaxis sensor kinase CheA
MSLLQGSGFGTFEADSTLEPFVIQVPTVPSDVDGQAVKEIFDAQQEVEGIVVTENSAPVGIIMRTTFYQKIGSLYGHSIYMKRPVSIMMDTEFMTVDYNDNISKIGIQAMNREHGKLYDYLVVHKNKTYIGVISIRQFLIELSKRNEAQINVLKHQQQKLISANERETHLRKDLEHQSASIRNLLDHADQGFLWFSNNLAVDKEYSYKCLEIFNQNIDGRNYLDLISPYFSAEKLSVFQSALDSYFENNSPVTDNVYLLLLPSDCIISGKNIRFQYRRIESNEQKAVMVILNDITEKVSMERAIEEDRNKQRLLIKAFGCQAQIKQMLEEFQEIFSGGYKNFFQSGFDFKESLNELFRAVHTFKGDFAQYGFISASEHLHQFEDELFSIVNQSDSVSIPDVERIMSKADPQQMLEKDLNVITQVLGKSYFDQSEIIPVPKSRLNEIKCQINSSELDKAAVISLIQSLQLKNVKAFLSQYRDYLQYLSGRVMKNMPVYIIEGDDVEIDGDLYGNFFKSLVHIFRNIMDHGIETDEERLERGKSERGLVECHVSRLDDGWFSIRISDDGRGIDLKKLKEKAVANNLYTAQELKEMSQSELHNLIFADHLSTKSSADALSGRGVGMSAVKEACLKLGGKIEIASEENKGTAFLMTLPTSDSLTGV